MTQKNKPSLNPYTYCNSLTQYSRRNTHVVNIGGVHLGGENPIRVQSMTTIDTMDTIGSVEQSIRMIEAGCEYVRITAPSIKEAKNLENIKKELRKRGYQTPLVADIHFTPNAAEVAARIVEKVRINPGNYIDKKKFEQIEYNDQEYQAEIEKIRNKFIPLINICKEYGTAMRIGTNHGSLSDRIMSRYGDTPIGMVESALEFIRICEELNYYQLVISMKSSNTQVMVQAYRLLVNKLAEEKLKPYPLHLGVTEAGEAEDGRIKSAVGIGTLLEDGLGDTVRVSLTEEPEAEMPVAIKLIKRYEQRTHHEEIPTIDIPPKNPFEYTKRNTKEVSNIGASNVPRVIADFSNIIISEKTDLNAIDHKYLPKLDKWSMGDLGSDYIYLGKQQSPFMLPNGLKAINDYMYWNKDEENSFPLYNLSEILKVKNFSNTLNFVLISTENDKEIIQVLQNNHISKLPIVLIVETNNQHAMPSIRRLFYSFIQKKLSYPIIIKRTYPLIDHESLQLHASTDIGGLLIDGFGDGIMLSTETFANNEKSEQLSLIKIYNELSFGILQAARTRMTKTEYISCPSCGRTLFDLQETTAMIRKRTDHLKGIKIGIMGCIVNGPGEMADADYGYVGSGRGKITLYRGQEVVKRGIVSEKALDELIGIIKEDGKWIEPSLIEV